MVEVDPGDPASSWINWNSEGSPPTSLARSNSDIFLEIQRAEGCCHKSQCIKYNMKKEKSHCCKNLLTKNGFVSVSLMSKKQVLTITYLGVF